MSQGQPVEVPHGSRQRHPSLGRKLPPPPSAARGRRRATPRQRQRERVQLIAFARGRRRRREAAVFALCRARARRSSARCRAGQAAPHDAGERRAAPGERCINSKHHHKGASAGGRVQDCSAYVRLAGGGISFRPRRRGGAHLPASPPQRELRWPRRGPSRLSSESHGPGDCHRLRPPSLQLPPATGPRPRSRRSWGRRCCRRRRCRGRHPSSRTIPASARSPPPHGVPPACASSSDKRCPRRVPRGGPASGCIGSKGADPGCPSPCGSPFPIFGQR